MTRRLDHAVSVAAMEATRGTGSFRHGAAVLNGREIVAVGRNHDRRLAGASSIHAEIDALRKVPPRHASSLHMVVVRVTNSGALAQSRPCDACMRALRQFRGMRTVAYSCTGGDVVVERLH